MFNMIIYILKLWDIMNCDNVNEVCIMVQFEELKLKLEGLKPEIDDLSDALGLSAIKVKFNS